MKKFVHLFQYLTELTKKGYNYTFELTGNGIRLIEKNIFLSPDNFTIKEYYKLDGIKDPQDASLIFAIESNDGLFKGALITAYSAFNDLLSADLIKKLALHPAPYNN
ncbi:hypothetical protein C3K47_17370 [Solitalea longa]|uniref:Phosphoribosylpyrophosphate synthetase n=1 Tax=Solitalea longa TaxID=2079460 RepID=A0A2S4ZYF2_9SPHI|nr:hypothetical protein [Solitalea longa]POY35027.1 hypothetical protein C3K47_17370 [Solitalea longa]